MKILFEILAAAAVVLLALPGESLTRRATRFLRRGKYLPGEVLSIEKVACGQGRHHGVNLLLKTAKGKLAVHLGPTWFVDSQRTKFAPHDVVEVAGSRVTFDGKAALIATEIRKGNERLRLRTPDGTPLWVESRAR